MAVVHYSGTNLILDTLASRDSIIDPPDGLHVQVNDTTGDIAAGGIPAVYVWMKSINNWILAVGNIGTASIIAENANASALSAEQSALLAETFASYAIVTDYGLIPDRATDSIDFGVIE